MKAQNLSVQTLDRFIAEHELITQFTRTVQNIVWGVPPQMDDAVIQSIKTFLVEQLPAHFDYEDLFVFPALEAATPTEEVSRLVKELSQEHKTLLAEVEVLVRELENPEKEVTMLSEALLDFVEKLDKHATKEDKLFPSQI